ncbi:MAG: DUF3108 domain-containing protein [Cocleimonas sp.]
MNILKTALHFCLPIAIFSLLLTTQVAVAIPNTFTANYTVAKGSLTLGNLHTSLKVSGGKYSYHKYTKATGLAALLTKIKIIENTDGTISGSTIKPTSYLLNKSQRRKSKIDRVQFLNNRVNGNYKGKSYNLAIAGNTQDRASLELVLARDLALNKSKLSYPVIESGKKKYYNFQRLGNEKTKTPAGTFNTIKVKVQRSGNTRETILWLGKEIDYMPVKIYHREKKDVITTVLKNYKKT